MGVCVGMAVTEHGARSGHGAYRVIRVVADRRARRCVTATSQVRAHLESII
jgi:hypothetical protein